MEIKAIRRILPNISMVITFFAPAQKMGRASKTPGSVLNRHYRKVAEVKFSKN